MYGRCVVRCENPTLTPPFTPLSPLFSFSSFKYQYPPPPGVGYRLLHMAPSSSSSSSSDHEGHEQNLQGLGNDRSALQKHVAFFDRNKDGIVYPWETYRGFRAIGCGILLSAVSAVLINIALSRKTRPGKFLSLLFPIEINNIHRAKHGSDSGVYDNEGRFVPSKFEEIFTKHAHSNSNALTSEELMAMLKSNRDPKDYSGWFASWTEWKLLYFLCKDKSGLLEKETIRGVYDGSLFERLLEDRASARKNSARSV